ncbi:MAG: hypothetical protein ACXWFX_09745, partial [Methylobacter sp.]
PILARLQIQRINEFLRVILCRLFITRINNPSQAPTQIILIWFLKSVELSPVELDYYTDPIQLVNLMLTLFSCRPF